MGNEYLFFKILGLVGLLADKLMAAAKDGKVTIAEGLDIIRAICSQLGIDFDETGWELTEVAPPNEDPAEDPAKEQEEPVKAANADPAPDPAPLPDGTIF